MREQWVSPNGMVSIEIVSLESTPSQSLESWPPEHLRDLDLYHFMKSPEDFSVTWHNPAGSAGYDLRNPWAGYSVYFQTPSDSDVFVCFAMKDCPECLEIEGHILSTGLLLTTNPEKAKESLGRVHFEGPYSNGLFNVLQFPLEHLKSLVEASVRTIANFATRMNEIQSMLSTNGGVLQYDFTELIQELHVCYTKHIQLERICKYEMHLGTAMKELMDGMQREVISVAWIDEHKSKVERQMSVGSTSEHTLEIISRQMENCRTTVYQLTAQRDARVTIELAEATMRDSTAMKTIAAVTLIFLPPTFLCSFFSMTFFDWKSEPVATPWLWLYFATMIPLTLLVISAWILFTRTSRTAIMKAMGIATNKEDSGNEGIHLTLLRNHRTSP